MKKDISRALALFIASVMILTFFASCRAKPGAETENTESDTTEISSGDATSSTGTDTSETEISSGKETSSAGTDTGETEGGFSESTSSTGTDTGETEGSTPKDTSSTEQETTEPEDTKIALEGEHADLIELSDYLKNNVTAYFPTGARENVIYGNMNMNLDYALSVNLPQQVTSLTNKNGGVYIENTMDVFVEMANGNRYYAKNSYTAGTPNIYRLGYYFYEMRVEGQTFMEDLNENGSVKIDHLSPVAKNGIVGVKNRDGSLLVVNKSDATDPNVTFSRSLSIDTSVYTMLEITMKADANTDTKADVYYMAGGEAEFSNGQRVSFTVSNDGEYHTYLIPLYAGASYTGALTGLRLDVNGSSAEYEISGMRLLSVSVDGAPAALSLCRTFNVYSDKMHQVIQIAATRETTGIVEIGIQTKISADTVSALIIKDKCEQLHTDLEGVDWSTVEYVGFDVKNAGIFGYILPYDGKGGGIRVQLSDGCYVIEQTMTPEGGTIIPSRTDYNEEKQYYNWVDGGNTNDFYMGSRVYTDSSHDFSAFLNEAYCERNPINANRIKVNETFSNSSSYDGYDSLRGIYRFNAAKIRGGFNEHYFKTPNNHYRTNFAIRSDIDRKIYVMTYTTSGQLECAVLLDSADVMIPVPLEVGKNFSEAHGERSLFNLDDATYGEVIFPLMLKADTKYEYTVVNLYQNWGRYPLKQLSWIQFHSPYYHLSTGVIETNCVLPWSFTDRVWYNTLPDHRGMSAPLWDDQPQHTYAGDHDWLKYTDSNGNVVRAENIQNTIDSYGPTYASVKMDYVTYDGKIKVSYTHSEMPQTDENRTYYEMTYQVLEDVTINNFVTDLQFYKAGSNDETGLYQKVGYLNEQNLCTVADANHTAPPVKYTLGDKCPYFSFFDMDNHSYSNGYANLSFLVHSSEFIIGGERVEPNFAIVNCNDTVYVTLDIEEQVTLKAGDSLTINAILIPWGSQQLDDGIDDPNSGNYEYTSVLADGTLYMDKNVRDVRENMLLNPLTAIAGEGCEAIESVYVPKVKSSNGVSAEFTLTGGYGNVAVRAYGFSKATVPVIYEKIDGEWRIYQVSSISADPEKGHSYDGYCVYYDGDGTYSYSFVTTMDGENDRCFRIVADGNYKPWEKETVPPENEDYLMLYVDPEELEEKITDATDFFTSATISEDGSYVTISPVLNCTFGESYATVYKAISADVQSGQYLVFKYRVPSTNEEALNSFDIYLSTVNKNTNKNDSITFTPIQDGEWHVAILDLSKFNHPTFTDVDGEYRCQYIRFDFFNKKHTANVALDIAYIAMDASLEEICKLNQNDFEELPIHAGSLVGSINTYTYETYFDIVISPDADIKLSTLPFGSALDSANGIKQSINVGSKEGGPKETLPISIDTDLTITLKGWCIVGGGVEKYVWSADGGLTWSDCGNLASLTAAPEKNLGAAKALSSSKGYEDVEASLRNASFQSSSGITVDLSEYKGETVSVLIAAVPTSEPDSLCLMYRFKDVAVPAQ